MTSRPLAAIGRGPEDYAKVYGPMFDPALNGYWGSVDVDVATWTFVEIVTEHAAKVDGVKASLLDAAHETRLRAALPSGVRVYTGDDFHYPALIKGDGARH